MTFFTGLGIFIAALFGYILLVGMCAVIMYESDDSIYFGVLIAGIILSLLFARFICDPEHYGYQKIDTVSECEVSE